MNRPALYLLITGSLCVSAARAQEHRHGEYPAADTLEIVQGIEPQPLLRQAGRLANALAYIGSALAESDAIHLKSLEDKMADSQVTKDIQKILDPYCLAMVSINPESRVRVMQGPAKAILRQGGWTSFLIKVYNESGSTAKLEVKSENAAPLLYASPGMDAHPGKEHVLTMSQVADRFLEMAIYRAPPMNSHLSGFLLEYVILQIYSKDQGQREAGLSFNIGQGTQDIGFRNTANILFTILPGVKVKLHIADDDGKPAIGSFLLTDDIERQSEEDWNNQNRGYLLSSRFIGTYPLPSGRMAATDEYPDFYFQPQVYRSDGEHITLSPGQYKVTFTRGPEYISQTQQLAIPVGIDSMESFFQLKRWINMASYGWYSADHHLHAAGCSHYASPEEGVLPPAMFRQVLGEDLNVASVLSWAPGWYRQKAFFTGRLNTLSTGRNLMRYDVEVSGFPSSHAGHLVLLNLKEDDYPGTTRIEEWPSWTLPILRWVKSQGGISGYAHSGWGLEPVTATTLLPFYEMPKMQGIGANEYIVAVTQHLIDFYSAGDTPAQWELNMWYHTLNCGFRPRLSGETDFPCIFDENVGIARSYFKSANGLQYDGYIRAIREGRSYVSDGRSHIIDFSVNNLELGLNNSELALDTSGIVQVKCRTAVYLKPRQDEKGMAIARSPLTMPPYWNTERARIADTRKVTVALIVNGEAVDSTAIVADGDWKEVRFTYQVKQSCWMALRIFPAAHTNPIFVLVNKQPIIVAKSALWCRQAVDQCWQNKQGRIRREERPEAEAAYNDARKIYEDLIKKSSR